MPVTGESKIRFPGSGFFHRRQAVKKYRKTGKGEARNEHL
ncbi:MAG: hypothetical protein DDT33_01196 [Firmicutes bacterium]|nr:hypothetical protein [Bacillota bacterium]